MNKYQSYINLNNMCFDRLPNTYLKPPKTNRHVTGGEKNKLMLSQSGSMRSKYVDWYRKGDKPEISKQNNLPAAPKNV